MSEMIERVARAMCVADMPSHDPDAPCFGSADRPAWTNYSRKARAAIEAMREPTEAMLKAGAAEKHVRGRQTPYAVFQAMIAAALNPGDLS